MLSYVPLWVKSNFSFLEGASHPQEMVEQAHLLGLPAIAITDRDGVYGIVQAHTRARELGIRLIVGAQVSVGDADLERASERGSESEREPGRERERKGKPRDRTKGEKAALPQRANEGRRRAKAENDAQPQRSVVLLAENRRGYANLCGLISKGRLRSEKGLSVVTADEVRAAAGGLIALCPSPRLLSDLREAFGERLYALCARHLRAEEQPLEEALRIAARLLVIPVVAANEVLYHSASRQALQDVLTCIRHGVTLSEAGALLRPNAEHDLKTPHAMRELFDDDRALLARTIAIAERCAFSLAELRYRYPSERIPAGSTEIDWLRDLTLAGARERYGERTPPDVARQIEHELALIHELDYGGYFLTMHEIVQFCRRENILCQGRGSAANSTVCFCLGITAVDPVKLDLLFERFLSRERAEPPDIDLDIEHNRREEVIQWVYSRYGRRHAAMVANVIRYRGLSAVREVGKALGLPLTALDRLSKLLATRFAEFTEKDVARVGLDAASPANEHLMRLAAEIQDFPRHLSIHPGGFLLGHEPVDTLVPIEPATMEGRTVIQWDKYSVEELSLFKLDLLGLGALTHVHECFDLMRRHEGVEMSMATVPSDDAATYAMISRSDTVGVFQIESRAQMSMLPRLRPRTFYDLVIEVAIVRPGPIQGNMVHPYLKRRSGEAKADYPHPSLERVLEKTLGVPIFQEQVMKIASLVGGYTPGEADQLRRDMAAWRSSGRIERHHDKLVGRMVENGIPLEFAENIFSQIRGFGEYGFPESHAASFALIAYVTAYLRCHHPAAFTCALLNAQPMGFYSPATIVEDAKRHGVVVRPIDVNRSAWNCTIEPVRAIRGGFAEPGHTPRAGFRDPIQTLRGGLAVRMGLRYVKGFGTREEELLSLSLGPYRSLEDFARRTRLSEKALTQIAQAGGFEGFDLSRRDSIWAAKEVARRVNDAIALPASESEAPLFESLPLDEQVFWDYRTSQHSARGHPMLRLRPELERRSLPDARTLNAMPDGTRATYVGMTICRQQPGTATGVTFYTLEDETGFVNLVVWRPVFERHSVAARTALLLGVSGRVQSESGVVHLVADRLWEPRLEFRPDGASTRSFH
jgi:error-prone DNA polymerase